MSREISTNREQAKLPPGGILQIKLEEIQKLNGVNVVEVSMVVLSEDKKTILIDLTGHGGMSTTGFRRGTRFLRIGDEISVGPFPLPCFEP